NFPIAIATWKSFPAIVAGNAVIWKPATETPIMANELMKIFIEAGLPEGVVNVVFGRGGDVGAAMVNHKDIRVISFTGSGETGSNIAAGCGRQLKKVSLEMGGKNAVVVMDDADLDLAADGIVGSAFGTSGQRCTACSRAIVHEDVKEELEKLVLEKMKELKIGAGLKDDIKSGPTKNQGRMHKIKQYSQRGTDEGAKLVAGGNGLSGKEYGGGLFFEPTVCTDATLDMRISQEEIFAPVVALTPATSFEEAIE